jgi:hypothetical protein
MSQLKREPAWSVALRIGHRCLDQAGPHSSVEFVRIIHQKSGNRPHRFLEFVGVRRFACQSHPRRRVFWAI